MRARIPGPTIRRASALLGRIVLASTLLMSTLVALPAPAQAATVAQLKAQLEALRTQAAPAGDAYDAAVTKYENTTYRIKQTDARIKSATKKLTAAEDALGARADSLYRQGGDLGVFDFVLGATSWDEFVTRLDFITIIAMSDAELVSTVKDTRAGLQTDRASLVEDAKTEKVDLAAQKSTYNALQAQLSAKKTQYDRLLAAVAKNSGSKHPPGPNGLVFPVHGIHYYSDSWGAPRSGGRHHMGTDIMSARGTPVLAVTSGSARPHWNTLGGNSITLTGSNGWSYYYAHLDHYAIHGTVHVKEGQVIGYVGNTGDARGGPCHLHFQMGPGARWVDPYPYLRGME